MLEYVALGLLIFVALVFFYGIIAIHDIPYEIAVKRNHPHTEMMHIAGWVSLFTLHAIWPFLWIWATLYDEERGWGMGSSGKGGGELNALSDRLKTLESRLADLESDTGAVEKSAVDSMQSTDDGE